MSPERDDLCRSPPLKDTGHSVGEDQEGVVHEPATAQRLAGALMAGVHLVDNMLPHTPYRQWVLSFPWPLRLLFAARPQWLTRVLGVVTRALSAALLKRAGVRHCEGARTGLVTFI